jgi:hypothetical protein
MNNSIAIPVSSTSTLEGSEQSAGHEYAGLSDHARSCARARGPFFFMRCAADAVQAFLAPRFVTMVVACALLIEMVLLALDAILEPLRGDGWKRSSTCSN